MSAHPPGCDCHDGPAHMRYSVSDQRADTAFLVGARHGREQGWDEGHRAACDLADALCAQAGHPSRNPYRTHKEQS